MNRFLIPLLIFLGSLLYSWFWNCYRQPHCGTGDSIPAEQVISAAPAADSLQADTAQVAMTPEESVLFEPLDVYFDSGKSSINRSAEIEAWLATAKAYLAKNPAEKLSVTGHTDSDGDDASNLALSEKRANLVKTILSKEGFSADALIVDGKGETEPIVANDTPENKAKNRRVSIRLLK
ncbi:MAG: OmpA family protein [Cytophagaceae bacterium]|nr:OmpA family protein [Cytophagaceae bacterium]MBK9933450.1 OmpA family protein [Cytophagaceae bacterium]MBL0302833.1 OmpA family protein [Cytophagaceae bacterium]MBL0325660.1 OmpA family protein [Cytophagaceae bacterium]